MPSRAAMRSRKRWVGVIGIRLDAVSSLATTFATASVNDRTRDELFRIPPAAMVENRSGVPVRNSCSQNPAKVRPCACTC